MPVTVVKVVPGDHLDFLGTRFVDVLRFDRNGQYPCLGPVLCRVLSSCGKERAPSYHCLVVERVGR